MVGRVLEKEFVWWECKWVAVKSAGEAVAISVAAIL